VESAIGVEMERGRGEQRGREIEKEMRGRGNGREGDVRDRRDVTMRRSE